MKLTEARIEFERLRKLRRIVVGFHVKQDHKDRLFNEDEVKFLVAETKGLLTDNNKMPTAVPGSFMYFCKDLAGRNVEIAVMIEDNIVVIHAFRRIK
jgi:hypothetical protein